MRVPVLVPLGPHLVPIRYYARLPDENDFGEYIVEDRLIRVSKARHATPAQVWHTLFHELAHAAVTLSGAVAGVPIAKEEAIICGIEFGLMPLLLFNPKAPGVRWRNVQFPFED